MVRLFVITTVIVQKLSLLAGIVIQDTSVLSARANFTSSKNTHSSPVDIVRLVPLELNYFKNKYYKNNQLSMNPRKLIPSSSIITTNPLYWKNNVSKIVSRRTVTSDLISRPSYFVKPIYETDDISSSRINIFPGYIKFWSNFNKDKSIHNEPRNCSAYYKSQELANAILILDTFLKPLLVGASYNSAVHHPPNPLLALVLSRYGKYMAGSFNTNVYSNLAVNNLNNNKPFGQYKYEYDKEGFRK